MTAIAFSIAAFFSTLAGGLFALRFAGKLHFILSFTGGVLLGVVCFEILPAVFEGAHAHGIDVLKPMAALVIGFLLFHALEKCVAVHPVAGQDCAHHHHPQRGVLSALALIGHSFMDGVGIGLAFHVSPAMGVTVAVAVLAHDFCDGLNTAGLMLAHRNTSRRTLKMVLLDAIAPVLGALSTFLFTLPPESVVVYLGFFAGFLLYIGAADILPEAHQRKGHSHPVGLIGLTVLGAALMYAFSHVGGHAH